MRRFYSDWRQGNKVYVYTVPRLNKKRGKILMGLCFCCGIFSLVAQRISGLEKQYWKVTLHVDKIRVFFYLGAVYCQNKNLQCVNAAKYTSAILIQYPEGSLVKSFAESGSFMYICNKIFRLKSTEILENFNSINHYKFRELKSIFFNKSSTTFSATNS